jgi:Family of unknown function (DUF6308)
MSLSCPFGHFGEKPAVRGDGASRDGAPPSDARLYSALTYDDQVTAIRSHWSSSATAPPSRIPSASCSAPEGLASRRQRPFAAGVVRRAGPPAGNRADARISAAQIAAILERRQPIEQALQAIAPDASLAGTADSMPWPPLGQLFGAFADIRGIGYSKMTKALHPMRPALIPLLDSIVQKYLQDDDLGAQAPFAERALGLVRGYQRDLDRNQAAVRAVRQELATPRRSASPPADRAQPATTCRRPRVAGTGSAKVIWPPSRPASDWSAGASCARADGRAGPDAVSRRCAVVRPGNRRRGRAASPGGPSAARVDVSRLRQGRELPPRSHPLSHPRRHLH